MPYIAYYLLSAMDIHIHITTTYVYITCPKQAMLRIVWAGTERKRATHDMLLLRPKYDKICATCFGNQ